MNMYKIIKIYHETLGQLIVKSLGSDQKPKSNTTLIASMSILQPFSDRDNFTTYRTLLVECSS